MANILTRFKDIMAANINSLLDKAEDPEKMIDQYLRNMEKDLATIKELKAKYPNSKLILVSPKTDISNELKIIKPKKIRTVLRLFSSICLYIVDL